MNFVCPLPGVTLMTCRVLTDEATSMVVYYDFVYRVSWMAYLSGCEIDVVKFVGTKKPNHNFTVWLVLVFVSVICIVLWVLVEFKLFGLCHDCG